MSEWLTNHKTTIINLMPLIALIIIIVGYFVPVSRGTLVLVGLVFGSLGRAIFPYYMSWKVDSQKLKFNYVYLMPVLITIATAVFIGIADMEDYMLLINPEAPRLFIYIEAIVISYGGIALLNGWRKWSGFFQKFWEIATGLFDQKKELTAKLQELIDAFNEVNGALKAFPKESETQPSPVIPTVQPSEAPKAEPTPAIPVGPASTSP